MKITDSKTKCYKFSKSFFSFWLLEIFLCLKLPYEWWYLTFWIMRQFYINFNLWDIWYINNWKLREPAFPSPTSKKRHLPFWYIFWKLSLCNKHGLQKEKKILLFDNLYKIRSYFYTNFILRGSQVQYIKCAYFPNVCA